MDYEYKCVGAPERPKRSRRAKTPSDRVAIAMEQIIRDEAINGWEYLRTDLVPVVEKSSFLGRAHEVHRAVLVFRRDLEARSNRPAERARRPDVSTELFGDAPNRRRPPGRRQFDADEEAPEPVLAPEPAPTAAAAAVEERPRRARAVPAEEPIRLTVDDMTDRPRARSGRDRVPPSGLG